MKNSNKEWDFEKLSISPRSPENKRNTYSKLQYSIKKSEFKKKITISFCSMLAVGILLFLVTLSVTDNTDSKSTNSAYAQIMKSSYINQTFVTKNESKVTFKPKEGPLLLGVTLIEKDSLWNETMSEGLTIMEETNDEPKNNPKYDMLLVLDNKKTIRLKLWITPNKVIFKDISSNKYYFIETEHTDVFDYIVNKITTVQ